MKLLDALRNEIRVRYYGLRTEKTYSTTIYTHVLPTGPLGVTSPADTPEPGTDVGLMLRQMAVMMQKLAPMAAALPSPATVPPYEAAPALLDSAIGIRQSALPLPPSVAAPGRVPSFRPYDRSAA